MATRVISTCIQYIDKFAKPSQETLKSMREMSVQAKATGRTLKKVGNTISSAGSTLTKGVTMPVAAVGTAAIKTAADYESAMSNVQAITGATGEDFKKLTQLGKDLGSSTAWSAQECAQAMQYTGMAGWTAADNIAGLKGILDLASASGTDLAATSDIMTDAISAFGYAASDSALFADTMTKACTSANVSVETLGESYKYCGAICGTMGYSIDEITTSLAVMGNQGIKGSQAGTTLKNAIANMAAPTKNMKAAMDDLGISITNQDGSMKSWGDIIKNLQSSFQGLTQDQQAAYAKQLFGKESMAGMLAIINTSTSDYNALAESIKSSGGAAEEAAQTQLNNLNGQLTLLKSALEGAAITIGDKLLPYIKSAVGWVQKATDWFNGLSDAQVSMIMKFAGIAAAIGPVLLIFSKVIFMVKNVYNAFGTVTAAIVKAKGVMGIITSPAGIVIAVLTAVAAAAFLMIKNWDKIKPVVMKVKDAFVSVMPTIKQTISNAIAAVMPIIQTLAEMFRAVLPQIINGFKEVFTKAMDGVRSIMPSAGRFIISAIQAAMQAVQAIVSALKTMIPAAIETVKTVIQAVMPIIQTIIATLSKVLPKVIETVKNVIKSITPIIKTVIGVVVKVAPIIASTFIGVLKKVDPIIKTLGNAIKKVVPIIGKLFANAFSFVGKIIAKVMPPITRVTKAIGGALVFAIRKVSPIVKKLAGVFSAVFSKVFSVVSTVVKKLKPVFNVIGTIVKTVMNVVKSSIGNTFNTVSSIIVSAVDGIKAIFGGLMDIFNGLIDFVTGIFTGNWRKAWEGVKGIFKGVFDALVGIIKMPINGVIGIINGAINGLNSISVDIPDWVPLVGGTHFGLNIPTIPTLAKGTDNWKGGIAQISEKGGEIVDLPKGSRVYPHDESVSIAKNTSNAKLSMLDSRLSKLEGGKGKTAETKEIKITIPKLADQIIVKDQADIDAIAEQIATNLKNTALNMGV